MTRRGFASNCVPAALVLCALPWSAAGQEADSREAQIVAERQAKAAAIAVEGAKELRSPGMLDAFRSVVVKGFDLFANGSHGWHLQLGGLAVGSGTALGPEFRYVRGDREAPDFIWDTFGVASFQGYYRAQTGVEAPRLFHDHAFGAVEFVRYDYPRLAFYGPGPESAKTGRTDYRMQDTGFDLRAGLKFRRRLRLGTVGQVQWIHLGGGTDDRIASIDRVYTNAQAHGLDRQTAFLSGGFFLQFENRDKPMDPHHGNYLFGQYQNVNGDRKRLGGFNQYDFEAQQYIPFWNQRRVIALRTKTVLTTPHPGTFVPFYLEPRLGGGDDLRGFRPYRFYDQNSLLISGEYRWSVFQGMDMALFADGGKVFHNWNELSFARIESDFGFGLRAKYADMVPLRVDVGFSREGFQVWVMFYNIF